MSLVDPRAGAFAQIGYNVIHGGDSVIRKHPLPEKRHEKRAVEIPSRSGEKHTIVLPLPSVQEK